MRETKLKTTNLQTMMHFIKGFIGPGVLAMPNAFSNTGLWLSTVLLPLMALLCGHCIHILLNAHQLVCKNFGCKNLEYEEVAQKAFLLGPVSIRKYAKTFKKVVIVFILVTQLGFCCIFALFVATSIKEVVDNLTSNEHISNVRIYLLFLLPIVIAHNFIKSLKHLSIGSAFANILQFVGMFIIFYDLFQDLPDISERPAVTSCWFSRFPIFASITIYSFEGIGLIFPLQKQMKDPKALRKPFGIVNIGLLIICVLYTSCGFFGYLKYGNAAESSINFNLAKIPLNEVCRLMLAAALFFSYAIQFYVPFNIIWNKVLDQTHLQKNQEYLKIVESVLRVFLVTLTFVMAALIPKLNLFISLVGAVCSTCLALIFPPIIEMATVWYDEKASRKRIIVKDVLLIVLGIVFFVIGTYTSFKDLVNEFREIKEENSC